MAKETRKPEKASQSPHASATFAHDILNSLTSHIAVLDGHGVIVTANEAWKRFARANGCKDQAFYIGANYLIACEDAIRRGDETADAVLRGIRAVLHGEHDSFLFEYPCDSPTEERWFLLRVTRFARGTSTGIVVAHEDMTQRKRAEIALQASEARFRNLTESLPDAVYILDLVNDQVAYFNHDTFLNYSRDELMAFGSILHALHPEDVPAVMAHWQEVVRGQVPGSLEYRMRNKAGHWEWVASRATIVSRGAHETPREVMLILTTITERKQAEEELRRAKDVIEAANHELQQALAREQRMARTDELTQVNNRRYFFDLARHEFTVAQRYHYPLSVILFDIDHFKRVNDTFGHQVGDEVLQQIARIAGQHLRAADILARYGGEEFVILLPNSTAQQAKVLGERIRNAIGEHDIDTSTANVRVTISAGIADILPHEDTLERLIQRADQALYAAKETGRNRAVRFSPARQRPK